MSRATALLWVLMAAPVQADESRLDAPGGLKVVVRWHGTPFRCADELVIDAGRGTPLTLRCQWNESGGVDEFVPMVNDALQLGRRRWLLLGWSSWGPDMVRTSGWIVDSTPAGVRLVDRLETETDRQSGGLAVDVKRGRVGLPRPDKGARTVWLVRKRQLTLAEAIGLPASRGRPEHVYAPFPRHQGWNVIFAWFKADRGGFSFVKR